MSVVFDKESTRVAFGNALVRMAEEDDTIMYVAADTLKSVGGTQIKQKYPNRALNIGIAEQNMALMGAGMAASGAKVFVATYATFASMRICEQIRTFICYPNLDVKIVAGLSGLSGGQEGVTHQGIEDVGVLRSIPNLVIVEPADAASTEVITEAITKHKGPVYMRIGRNASPTVFDDTYKFEIGKANSLIDKGNDAAIFTTGAAVRRALDAEKILAAEGYGVKVIEMPCIKPLDEEAVIAAAKATGLVFTTEDHNIIGGLGSAVSEVLSEKYPTRVERIGIRDQFTESADHEELLDKYCLFPRDIADCVIAGIKNK
ncbi:transketolase family protein [Lactonifactor longoviformis]|uniref:transketolase family protein n=1 Tax=Lactonifactor longoviformis TaxID=341220 RepID=UPI00210C7AD1|nr:transketolase C-terminal domain-containing protein [Lactonifactor longoviformis]MCQ4672331.1 transketolase family protein [Lactonifactor longoviformis]